MMKAPWKTAIKINNQKKQNASTSKKQCPQADPSAKEKKVPTAEAKSEYARPLVEFPHTLRIIGPKHIKILMQFFPSAIIYGITSLILITYMTEWKAVLQYMPYYNGKYQVEEKTDKTEKVEEGGDEE